LDLLHRFAPQFPEASRNGAWESREYCYRNAAATASLLLVDSETSRQDVLRYYRPGADRVCVLPYAPSIEPGPIPGTELSRVRARYRLPKRYFFYPAQFWKHKNHVRLVRALKAILPDVPDAHLVLCGRQHNGYADFASEVRLLGLETRVRYLGYVPDDDMRGLYAAATAVVVPTFNAPLNLPVIDAFCVGVPVITSDLRGIREHVEDAALRVDPTREEEIARAMKRVWSEEALRRELAERGRRKLALHTAERFRATLIRAIEDALRRGPRRRPAW